MALSPLVLLLGQLGGVLVTAILLGQLAQRLRLPTITGELLAGVVLGPTVLGHFPAVAVLFPPPANDPVQPIRANFLMVGLLLFILLVGLEIDPNAVRHRIRTILPTSAVGMIVPFAIGFCAVLLFPPVWGQPAQGQSLSLPLMIGVALSISALPVIARTLTDLGLVRTDVGRIILSSAVLDDLCGWLAFAAIVSTFAPSGEQGRPVWQTLLIIVGTFAITLTLGRRVGGQIGGWLARHPRLSGLGLGVILAATLLTAAVMESTGAHAFFGALVVGVALSTVGEHFFEPLTQVVRYFFTPLYFGAVGLGVDFVASFDLGLVVLVFLIACAGKLVGAGLGAWIGGCRPREAAAIASGMNARGAVEILLATLALSSHIINERLFVALVIMALATSVTAGPLMQRILRIRPPGELVRAFVPVLQRLDQFGQPMEEIEIGDRLTIGRHPANRLALTTDPLASLEHALIKKLDGRFRIEDLGSTNGTLLWHNTRWQEVGLDDLQDGDMVVIGSNVFRFSQGAREG